MVFKWASSKRWPVVTSRTKDLTAVCRNKPESDPPVTVTDRNLPVDCTKLRLIVCDEGTTGLTQTRLQVVGALWTVHRAPSSTGLPPPQGPLLLIHQNKVPGPPIDMKRKLAIELTNDNSIKLVKVLAFRDTLVYCIYRRYWAQKPENHNR